MFSWSYTALTVGAARLFRLLGVHPGPDIATFAAASLAGVSAARIRPMLDELARAHLLTEHAPGRFALHDLLYTYAFELVRNLGFTYYGGADIAELMALLAKMTSPADSSVRSAKAPKRTSSMFTTSLRTRPRACRRTGSGARGCAPRTRRGSA